MEIKIHEHHPVVGFPALEVSAVEGHAVEDPPVAVLAVGKPTVAAVDSLEWSGLLVQTTHEHQIVDSSSSGKAFEAVDCPGHFGLLTLIVLVKPGLA